MWLNFCFSDKIQALVYSSGTKQLLSVADDKMIAIWSMDCERIEVSIIIVHFHR